MLWRKTPCPACDSPSADPAGRADVGEAHSVLDFDHCGVWRIAHDTFDAIVAARGAGVALSGADDLTVACFEAVAEFTGFVGIQFKFDGHVFGPCLKLRRG